MPSTTRQNILQEFDGIDKNLSWVIRHLEQAQQFFVEGQEEYQKDYTEHINAFDMLINATEELSKAIDNFRRTRI